MIFLSTLLRHSVYDNEHHRVGSVRDVCVTLNETFPVVTALLVAPGASTSKLFIPWSQIQSIEEDTQIPLSVNREQIIPYEPSSDEIFLKRDILDKQIVDTQGFRVVKVNDLKLAQIKKTARLVGVDISLSGLLRRLGVQPALNLLERITPLQLPERTITWNYVEPIQMVHGAGTTGQLAPVLAGVTAGATAVVPQVQLNVSHNKLAYLRPADIADILEQLDVEEAGAMLDSLDMETAADTLNEVEYPLQSELLSELDPERASDLLERMAPDDAADILAEIPHSEAERLLNLMPANESQPIRELLRYGAETAGGIMTTEVLALQQESTVSDALLYLRQHSEHLEMVYYLYVIDLERHLKGVVSLRQLVTAEPETRIQSLMNPDVIHVQTIVDQEEVARVIAKYDLLGVPVVDDGNHLVGLITVDDVIDVIHEEQAEDFSELAGTDVENAEEDAHFSWNTVTVRSFWLFVNTLAGFVLALLITQLFKPAIAMSTALASNSGIAANLPTNTMQIGLLCMAPMLLLTCGCTGTQSLSVAGWQLRTKHGSDFWRAFLRELLQGTLGGVATCLMIGILTFVLFHAWSLTLAITIGSGIALLIASICGVVLPNLLQRLRLRGSLITAPLLDPAIALISLSIFLTISLALLDAFTF